MKKILQILISVLSLTISVGTFANQTKDADIVKQAVDALMEENKVPGVAALVYVEGKPEAYYFGYANVDKKIPVSANTIFELGSISKVMTSLLLAQEVDAAKLQLDDSIINALPQLPTAFDDMSFKNLATHTSGLPFAPPNTLKSRAELEKYLQKWQPKYDADEEWTYSNFGIGMLGFALEARTHQNINQLYRKNILTPLHMQAIGITVSDKLKKYYAQGHDKTGLPIAPSKEWLFPAAGAMKASASDMERFLGAAIGLPGTPDKILYPMRMTQSSYVKLEDRYQGLGWQIHPLATEQIQNLLTEKTQLLNSLPVEEVLDKPKFDGDALIEKTGTTNGFRAYIAVIPNKKTGIVLLMNKNIDDNDALQNTARRILFKLNNIEAPINVEAPVSATDP